MKLVTHCQGFGDDRFQFNFSNGMKRAPHGGSPHIPPEPQCLQGFLMKIAKLLAPLHLTAECPVSKFFIFDHPNRRGRRDGPCHGTDCLMMMVGLKLDLTAPEDLFRFLRGFRPTFINRLTHDGSSLSSAHPFPFNRRTGVSDQLSFEIGDHLAGWGNVHQDRVAFSYRLMASSFAFSI